MWKWLNNCAGMRGIGNTLACHVLQQNLVVWFPAPWLHGNKTVDLAVSVTIWARVLLKSVYSRVMDHYVWVLFVVVCSGGHYVIRHMTTRTVCAANNCMLSSSKYTFRISMCIDVSQHLGCYSVGTAELSLEDCAVDSAIVILSIFLPYTEGNGKLRLYLFSHLAGFGQFGSSSVWTIE